MPTVVLEKYNTLTATLQEEVNDFIDFLLKKNSITTAQNNTDSERERAYAFLNSNTAYLPKDVDYEQEAITARVEKYESLT